ncbi:hypothetical protein GCM10020254_49280 [Streptomyces goshikiensis]
MTEGRYDEHMKWTVGINKRLGRDGRVYQGRTHVFTAFQDHVATVYRDGAAGPRDFHALDHPYAGLVLQVVDADGPEQRAELLDWLRSRALPKRLAGSAAAMVTAFRPTPLPGDRMTYVKQVEGGRHPADPALVPGGRPAHLLGPLRGAGRGGRRGGAGAGGAGGPVHPDGAGDGPVRGPAAAVAAGGDRPPAARAWPSPLGQDGGPDERAPVSTAGAAGTAGTTGAAWCDGWDVRLDVQTRRPSRPSVTSVTKEVQEPGAKVRDGPSCAFESRTAMASMTGGT